MPKVTQILAAFSVAGAILVAPAGAVLAGPEQIGLAAMVRNNVSRVEPTVSKILQGDDVVRDEVVQTFADSNAKLVLKDSTNLILGPNSRLKLDKAVFSGEPNLGDIAIKLSVGSFRFVTGNSAKESYAITTPIATMGVRGTTLDFLVERAKNTVVLKDGQAIVCAAGKCVDLLRKGDTAVVTANGARIEIELQPFSTWSFDSACNGMCSPMSFAQAQESLTTGSIGAGGGGGTAGGGGGGTNFSFAAPPSVGEGGPPPSTGATANRTVSPLLTSGFGSARASPVSPF